MDSYTRFTTRIGWQGVTHALMIGLLFASAQAGAQAPVTRLSVLTSSRPPLTDAPMRKGFLNEIAREAFGRLGIQIEMHIVPVERALINVNAGLDDVDMLHIAGQEQHYPNIIRVPESVLDNEFVAYARRPDIRIRRWEDLKPYAVGYPANWRAFEDHVPAVKEVTRTSSPTGLLPLMDKGRIDVILLSRRLGVVMHYESRHGLILQEPPLLVQPSYIYLNKKHAALAPQLAQALRRMKADGTFGRIYDATLRAATGY